jgi:hypothetical protein
MSGKLLDRGARENTIEMVFINNYHLGKVDELTAAQVARELMLEPSAFIRERLAGMVEKGILTMRKVSDARLSNLKGGHDSKYWYRLSEKRVAKLESDSRSIEIKKGSKVVGQLKLW